MSMITHLLPDIVTSIKFAALVGAVSGCRFPEQSPISHQGHNEKQTLRILFFCCKNNYYTRKKEIYNV